MAAHIRDSEVCATCHQLYTRVLGPGGKSTGIFPEQMPYLEWKHSDYPNVLSCQGCHMPEVHEEVPVAAVLAPLRSGVRQHTFIGGNFFMLRMLDRYRDDLDVSALPTELELQADRTADLLQTQTARVSIRGMEVLSGNLIADVGVENLTGHKLPTAYPSRRAWLHFVVKDRDGKVVFESGALNSDGSIRGNDNDVDAQRFEPHYSQIVSPEQVQITTYSEGCPRPRDHRVVDCGRLHQG